MARARSRTPRVLVTGAAGHAGGEVLRACMGAGLPVRAADAGIAQIHAMHGECVEGCRLDFAEPTTYEAALRGCDSVFLVRPATVFDMESTLLPFIDAAIDSGIRHIVFMSVAGAATNAFVPHHAVEKFLACKKVQHTLLRPGFFAHNLGVAYREDIAEDDRLYLPAGRGRVAFVDVRDLAEVVAKIFAEPKKHVDRAYTCTGPEALSFEEAARLLTDVIGRQIRYEAASIAGYVRHLHVRGVPVPQIGVQTLLHVGLRFGVREEIDPTLAALLGRRPRTLATYIRDAAHVWEKPVRTPATLARLRPAFSQ